MNNNEDSAALWAKMTSSLSSISDNDQYALKNKSTSTQNNSIPTQDLKYSAQGKKDWKIRVQEQAASVELLALLDDNDTKWQEFSGGQAVYHSEFHLGFIEWTAGAFWPNPPAEITCWLSFTPLKDATFRASLPRKMHLEKIEVRERSSALKLDSSEQTPAGSVEPLTKEHVLPAHFFIESQWCLEKNRPAFVALDNREVAAFAYSPLESKHYFDISVETFQKYRRRGFAKKALQQLLSHKVLFHKTAVWGTSKTNTASLALAHSLGFSRRENEKKSLWRLQA